MLLSLKARFPQKYAFICCTNSAPITLCSATCVSSKPRGYTTEENPYIVYIVCTKFQQLIIVIQYRYIHHVHLVGGPPGVLPSPSPGQVLGWWASGCTPLPLTRPSAWLVGLWVYSPPPHQAKCLVGGPLGVLPSPSPGQVLGWWPSGCTPLPLTRPSAWLVGRPLGVLPSPSPGQVLGWWASGCTPLPLTRPSAWLVGLWVYSPPPHQAKCLVGGPLGVLPSPSPGNFFPSA